MWRRRTSHPRRRRSAERRENLSLPTTRSSYGRCWEHVRDGFVGLDAGEIDEFELDDLIHRYKRAATELWKFCGNTGGQWLQAANTLAYLRDQGEVPDWWAGSASRQ